MIQVTNVEKVNIRNKSKFSNPDIRENSKSASNFKVKIIPIFFSMYVVNLKDILLLFNRGKIKFNILNCSSTYLYNKFNKIRFSDKVKTKALPIKIPLFTSKGTNNSNTF